MVMEVNRVHPKLSHRNCELLIFGSQKSSLKMTEQKASNFKKSFAKNRTFTSP